VLDTSYIDCQKFDHTVYGQKNQFLPVHGHAVEGSVNKTDQTEYLQAVIVFYPSK
jgi:hypothetical protein